MLASDGPRGAGWWPSGRAGSQAGRPPRGPCRRARGARCPRRSRLVTRSRGSHRPPHRRPSCRLSNVTCGAKSTLTAASRHHDCTGEVENRTLVIPRLARDTVAAFRARRARCRGRPPITTVEALVAYRVDVVVDPHASATPTPIISHTFLEYDAASGAGRPTGSWTRPRTTRRRRLQVQQPCTARLRARARRRPGDRFRGDPLLGLGLGVDRSAAPAPRPSTGSAEGMVDRLKRTCRSPACVGNAHSPHQERARDRTPHGPPRQILGTCSRRKGNARRARPDSCI